MLFRMSKVHGRVTLGGPGLALPSTAVASALWHSALTCLVSKVSITLLAERGGSGPNLMWKSTTRVCTARFSVQYFMELVLFAAHSWYTVLFVVFYVCYLSPVGEPAASGRQHRLNSPIWTGGGAGGREGGDRSVQCMMSIDNVVVLTKEPSPLKFRSIDREDLECASNVAFLGLS